MTEGEKAKRETEQEWFYEVRRERGDKNKVNEKRIRLSTVSCICELYCNKSVKIIANTHPDVACFWMFWRLK